jgi:hypothetical protein
MNWRESARCAHPAVDPQWFADAIPDETGEQRTSRLQQAATVCAGCPVRDECLAEGIADKHEGIWGKHMMPAHIGTSSHRNVREVLTAAEERARQVRERDRRNASDREKRARRNAG